MKNTGGTDGAGLCVFTSIEIAGHWDHAEELRGFQSKMTKEAGGGYPDKVDAMLTKYAPSVQYIQYSGNDPSLIKLALKTGRMVCVTYGYSPRYGGSGKISHMVDCVHLTDKWAAVLDNNFPGESQYEWMAPDEFLYRWKLGGGGWIVVVLSGSPPPPIPVNTTSEDNDEHPLPTPWGCNCAAFCFCKRGDCKCKTGNQKCCPLCRCSVKPQPAPVPTPVPSPEPKPPQRMIEQCPGGCCGGGMCSIPQKEQNQSSNWEWRTLSDHPGQWYLFKGGVQQGCLDMDEESYHPYDAATGKWGAVVQTPVGAPADAKEYGRKHRKPRPCPKPKEQEPKEQEGKDTIQDFGVSRDKIPELASGETFYTLNGTRVDASTAFRLVEKGGTLIDDSTKQRLTIIGSQDEVNKVLQDLKSNAKLSALSASMVVGVYGADHWAINGVGLPHDGHPTIIIQSAPDTSGRGKVLHVQRDYQGGAEDLATAIRRADPNYDPSKDPDLRKKKANTPEVPQPLTGDSCIQPIHLWCILISLGGLALRQFAPDLAALWQNTTPKVVGFFQSKKNQELEDLKEKLAAQLQRLQAIQPATPTQPEPKPAG